MHHGDAMVFEFVRRSDPGQHHELRRVHGAPGENDLAIGAHRVLARTVPVGNADRVWMIGDLLDAALATQPITPKTSAPDRRKRFVVIEGGKGESK